MGSPDPGLLEEMEPAGLEPHEQPRVQQLAPASEVPLPVVAVEEAVAAGRLDGAPREGDEP